jgi:hypothetical protein
MWQAFGSAMDVFHAFLMAAWVVGLPLLFVRRWPRLTRAYGIYAIVFIALSQASDWLLGECFLTSIAGQLWSRAGSAASVDTSEWFTVRLAKWVFDMAPSHRSIVITSEVLIFATAVGVILTLREKRPTASGVKMRVTKRTVISRDAAEAQTVRPTPRNLRLLQRRPWTR